MVLVTVGSVTLCSIQDPDAPAGYTPPASSCSVLYGRRPQDTELSRRRIPYTEEFKGGSECPVDLPSIDGAVGDKVRVRSVEQILATLDGDGCIDALPFMPEMLKYCGTEMEIYRSAHKTCDSVNKQGDTREMANAFHLVGARCDGGFHDGCEGRAACISGKTNGSSGSTGHRSPSHTGAPRSSLPVSVDTLHALQWNE